MTTILYLIRHGEVYNPDNIIYGRLPNFGLSDTGKEQIEEIAEFLKDKKIDVVFASPLLRAKQTAEIISEKLGIQTVQNAEQINEVRTAYQGRKFDSLDKLQSEVYLKPLDPSDETIEQIATRMKNFLTEILHNYAGKHIVACSHGDPIMILRTVIENKPLEFYSFKTSPYIKHGEIYQITADENTLSVTSIFKPIREG